MGLLRETVPCFETMDGTSQCKRHCLAVKGWADDKDDADDGQGDDYEDGALRMKMTSMRSITIRVTMGVVVTVNSALL